jgi:hypothetical protein
MFNFVGKKCSTVTACSLQFVLKSFLLTLTRSTRALLLLSTLHCVSHSYVRRRHITRWPFQSNLGYVNALLTAKVSTYLAWNQFTLSAHTSLRLEQTQRHLCHFNITTSTMTFNPLAQKQPDEILILNVYSEIQNSTSHQTFSSNLRK